MKDLFNCTVALNTSAEGHGRAFGCQSESWRLTPKARITYDPVR